MSLEHLSPNQAANTRVDSARATSRLTSWFTVSIALLLAPLAVGAETTVGYVVSVEGEAYAQAPGEEARRLECDSPIYRHDLITTMDDPGLAIMSGDAYVRLAGQSTLRFGTLAAGPPDLDLQKGHVRMMNMGNGSGSGSISTPGLILADARSNSEAIVFAEKIWTVSMICSRDDVLGVERKGNPSERMVSNPGQCTISKPKEPLYTADASHKTLEMLAREQCGPNEIELGMADYFAPGDLAALLPAVGAVAPGFGPPALGAQTAAILGCTVGSMCTAVVPFVPRVPPPPPVGPGAVIPNPPPQPPAGP